MKSIVYLILLFGAEILLSLKVGALSPGDITVKLASGPEYTVEFPAGVFEASMRLESETEGGNATVASRVLTKGEPDVTVQWAQHGQPEDYITQATSKMATGGAGDGEWRVTLQWAKKSKDLDSWTFMGENAKEKVYYVDKSITDSGTDVEAILDRDDVSGYGPETTTFKGIGTCVKKSNCLLKFYVDNYTPESKDMGDSKAKITLYKGSRTVKEYEIPTTAGAARQWPIFTLDASKGAAQELYDGDMTFDDDGELIPNPKPYGSGSDDDEYTYYYDDDY